MSKKNQLRDTDKDVITISASKDGGFRLDVKNPDGTEWGGKYYGLLSYDAIRNLEGKLLTLIDATFTDKEQRKAMKDVFRRTLWFPFFT